METYHVGLIALAFFALLAAFAFFAWRRRILTQERMLAKPSANEGVLGGSKCFYVATTFANRPLDRVIAYGLAHRGNASLSVSEKGLNVERTGETGFRIPQTDLIEVSTGSAVIDRAVEKEGLVVIKWNLGGVALESHFRFVDAKLRAEILSALKTLVGA